MAAIFYSLEDEQLIRLLKNGAVGVLPTDTVYGLVCSAANKTSVKRLYGLKNRQSKPGTIVSANIEQLTRIGIKRAYLKAVEHLWPGEIS
ncbi:MAG: L-threonylcarbamoyladenylate synthase, partial [Minisyncoccia bacterium]